MSRPGSLARKKRRGVGGKAGSRDGDIDDAAGQGNDFLGDGYYSNADGVVVRVRPEDAVREEEKEEEEEGPNSNGGPPSKRQGGTGGAGGPALLSECLHSCLDSIQGLAAEVDAASHAGMVELLRGHVFVGMVGGGWTNEVDFAFLSFCIQGV